jgi:hypothetical protein
MDSTEIRYMLRHVFDKELRIPGYSTVISQLAHLYATDKDAYNMARSTMHSITGDAYVA